MSTLGRRDRLTEWRERPSTGAVFSGSLALAVGALVCFPLLAMLVQLFHGSDGLNLGAFAEAARLPGLAQTLGNTLLVILLAGTVAFILGATFAWLNERTDARMTWVAAAMPVLPILMPPIAMVIGWVLLLSPRAGLLNVFVRSVFGIDDGQGPLNIFSWTGMGALYALELTPFVYLLVSAALRDLDPALEQASRVSGRGPLRTLWHVTLPSIRPALAASALLVVAIGLSIFSVPSVVGATAKIDVLSVRIVNLLYGSYPPRTGAAVALSFLMLLLVGVAWLIRARIVARSRPATVGGKGSSSGRVVLGWLRRPAQAGIVLFVALTTVIPFAALLIVSLQKFWSADIRLDALSLNAYAAILRGGTAGKAVSNSILLGALTATAAMAVTVLLTLFSRERRGVFGRAIDGVMKLPAGFPHVFVAVAVLLAFAGPPLSLGGTLAILLLGYFVIYLPQASIAADAAAAQVRDELTQASRVSGAGEWRTLRRVTLPLMRGAIGSGWVVVFAFVVGDLTASILLATHSTPTAGYLLLEEYVNGSYPLIAALALVISVASSAVVLTMLAVTGRKLGR
ncbi:MAG: iron ABC transporter permease [Gammaproteobacteria bacterium]|nr:iron ABC transporter permease [Gammaproteobacteria bacterium]